MRWFLSLALGLLIAATPVPGLAQDKYFDANGVKIRYVERGTGEPIILLHGIGGSAESWITSGVFERLAADYRVIAFDARGHGKSEKPHDPKRYGKEMALDVVRLLDHLSLTKAHIIGYSMGAFTTSQLLTLHPERFRTATLGGGAGRFRWTDEDTRMAEQEASEREKECVSRTLIYRLTPTNAPKPSEEDINRRSAACLADSSQDRFAIAAVTRARRDNVIPLARAAAVTVPTLGIAGNLDPNVAGLQELKKVRPTLRLVVIDGAVHSSADPRGAMRSPIFVAALREFLGTYRERATQ